jgi:uncharacterized membrane protein YdjX (TVP38/TMEM64 family)
MIPDNVMAQVAGWFASCGEPSWTCGLGLAACVIVASLGLPRAVLNVVAGATFGLWSLLIIQPSIAIGATIAFLVARYLLADRVRAWTETRPLATAIADSIDWKIVALTRLASPLPSFIASYLFGITKIGVAPFTLATLICTFPQNLLQIYVGATGRAIILEGTASPLQVAWMTAGLICLAATTVIISQRARAALHAVAATDKHQKL